MIGLEYLVKELNITFKDVSDKLSISPKTINDWVKGRRKIPEQRKQELSKIFAEIPPELFQKEVTEDDKKEIDFKIAIHRHNYVIKAIETKVAVEGKLGGEDAHNLFNSLLGKMVGEGIDKPNMGKKLDAIKTMIELMTMEYDERVVDVIWQTMDNLVHANDEYIEDLIILNREYME